MISYHLKKLIKLTLIFKFINIKMNFSIVVATDKKNGIGKYENEKYYIPWKSSIDMQFFKNLTKKNVVIMGRNTFFSLPEKNGTRCLSDRINIVISSKPELFTNESNLVCLPNFNDSLNYCTQLTNVEKVFVIGGSKLYEEALKSPFLEEIFWNVINCPDEESNIFFPISQNNLLNYSYFDDSYDLKSLNSDKIEFNKYIIIKNNNDESNYLKLLKNILENGDERQTRNSITKSIFGERLEFDLKKGFPLLTSKKMFLRGIFEELIWFFQGNTDSKILEEKNVNIWKWNSSDEFINSVGLPYRAGDIGNMYGFQWKHAGAEYEGCDKDYSGKGFNQIEYCLNLLKTDKYSRRILMTTYVPHEASKGVLYPCHGLTVQWYVREFDGINYLSCHMYQRSADMFLGVPFNISSYSLMCYMFCEVLNNDSSYNGKPFKPDKLVMSFGDLHIYETHYEQVSKQIERYPYRFPQIKFKRKLDNLEDFIWDDIEILNYNHHKGIKAEMVA